MRATLRRVILAAALALCARSARATIGTELPVHLVAPSRWLDPRAAEVGLRFEVPHPGVLSVTEVRWGGVAATIGSAPEHYASSAGPVDVAVRRPASGSGSDLTVRYRYDGAEHESRFDLRAEATDLALWSAGQRAPARGAAADGPRERSTSPSAAASTSIHLHGNLIVNMPDASSLPAESCAVQVYDSNTLLADQLLGSTTTDGNGHFDVNLSWPSCLLCESAPDLYLRVQSTSTFARVVNPIDGQPYTWFSAIRENESALDVDYGDVPVVGVDFAFAELTELLELRRFTASLGFPLPLITCETGAGLNTQYLPGQSRIQVSSDWEWNQWSMFHEFGHFWQDVYAHSTAAINYSNGVCDSPRPGHCLGCAETPAVGWVEGFADWYLSLERPYWDRLGYHFLGDTRQETFETWSPCVAPGGSPYPAVADESHVAALLNDLADAAADRSAGTGQGDDRVAYSVSSILTTIATNPPNVVEDLYQTLRLIHPADTHLLWRTAMNNEMDFDHDPPAAPGALTCTDHTTGTPSTDATLNFTWTRPSDDGSGVVGYAVEVGSGAPPTVGTNQTVGDILTYRTGPLAPGTYYFGIRAVDIDGNWGPQATAGPFVVKPAGTVDAIPYAPPGWYSSMVLHEAADATEGSVPAPTALHDSTLVYLNAAWANLGPSGLPANNMCYMMSSGNWNGAGGSYSGTLPANTYTDFINYPIGRFRGGRTTLSLFADGAEVVAESDETNNVEGEQWAFSPNSITNRGPLAFPRPPLAVGGYSDITNGETPHYNCFAFRVSASSLLQCVTLQPRGAGDVDLRMHPAYTDAKNSYTSIDAQSDQLQDLDAIFIPEGNNGIHDFSAYRTSGGAPTDSFVIEHLTAVGVPFGVDTPYLLNTNESMRLFTADVPADAANVGLYLTASGGKPLRLALLDASVPRSLRDATQRMTGTDELGVGTITSIAAAGKRIGIAVYREPEWGTGPVTFTLGVIRSTPDAEPITPSGWFSSIVPLGNASGTDASVPAPTTLPGDQAGTYLNAAVPNIPPVPNASPAGAVPASANVAPLTAEIRLDGSAIISLRSDSLQSTGSVFYHSSTPITVSGGRHTVSLALDPGNVRAETNEANNTAGQSWVWTPATLAPGAVTTRPAPPVAQGGWADTKSLTPYPNCDGLRMPVPLPSGNDGWWLAFAAMPGANSDVDLNLHAASTGAQNGFDVPLATSAWGPGESEYVLANFRAMSPRAMDAGIVERSGTQPYTAQVASSTWLGAPPTGLLGPFTVPAGKILALYEASLPAGLQEVVLEEAGGNIDWGLSLHAADSSAVGKSVSANQQMAWTQPAGTSEIARIQMPASGRVAIVVWKHSATQLGVAGSFRLRFIPSVGVESDGATARTRLASIAPNPGRGSIAVEFEVGRDGPGALEVFDVRGALVRTIERGAFTAGPHSRTWDGLDEAGRAVPGGLYFVRLQTGGATDVRRVARLE